MREAVISVRQRFPEEEWILQLGDSHPVRPLSHNPAHGNFKLPQVQ